MGFKVKRKAYRLKFADGSPLDGATITMGSLNTGEFLKLRQSAGSGVSEIDAGSVMLDLVADKLVSWDLEEEDGTPIPATRDGVLSLEMSHVLALVNPWLEAVQGTVDVPLPDASSDGERQTLEASIPMELSSTSQAS